MLIYVGREEWKVEVRGYLVKLPLLSYGGGETLAQATLNLQTYEMC